MKTVFLANDRTKVESVYSAETMERLTRLTDIDVTKIYCKDDVIANPELFREVEYIFTTWSMPGFEEDEIKKYLPSVKAVFYAAGSVQYFARQFIHCGAKVFSSWAANAVPVAEFTVAEILLANKGFYVSAQLQKEGKRQEAMDYVLAHRGNYGCTVGIIGAGMIGALTIELLKAFKLKVLVFDPFLSDERAEKLGVEKCSLERIFSECSVISNHLANNAQTKGMLNGKLFSLMQDYATFLNTGRGAQVVEEDLIEALEKNPTLTAVLDVTEPEPPLPDSKFYTLPNVILTPHAAGSQSDEFYRMSEYAVNEYEKLVSGQPTSYEVTLKMLETMA